MLVQLRVEFRGLFERLVEILHTLRHDLFRRSRLVICLKLVVRELEDIGLSNLAIHSSAMGAMLCLPTLFIDLLAYLCPLEIIDSWLSQLLEEGSSFGMRK